MTPSEKPPTSAVRAANRHADFSCEKRIGPFSNHEWVDRYESFLAGAEWQSSQAAEAAKKLEVAWGQLEWIWALTPLSHKAFTEVEKVRAQLAAAISLLKEGKK